MSELYPLPEAFVRRMQGELGGQADAYFASLNEPYLRGLRLNPRKPLESPAHVPDGLLEPIPWQAQTGYYIPLDSAAGAHPLHEAGAYYLQEPSAMAAVSVLAPLAGETVLDLCAAPGGKSTQIADAMDGRGLLCCNEPVPTRARILSRNLERMGVCNALVVSAEPERLAALWPECFDAVLVDAPCSGEGMFRRHPETRAEWSEQSPEGCAARQSRILLSACEMLKPGGRLVYSTCTLNRIENEGVIQRLLENAPQMEAAPFALPAGAGCALAAKGGTLHLYPHEIKGEGHFIALLHKKGGSGASRGECLLRSAAERLAPPDKPLLAAYQAFAHALDAQDALPEATAQLGDTLVAAPPLPPLGGVRVLRAGLQLGALKGKAFMPDHALAMGLTLPYALPTLALDEAGARAYQRGEALPVPESVRGFILPAYEGLALGFGKASDGQLRNHYPKGLRRP